MAKTSKKTTSQRASAQKRKTAGLNPADSLQEMHDFRWRERRDLLHVGIVLGVAIALRLVIFYLNQRNDPVFSMPIMDALNHDEWARVSLVAGLFAALYWMGDCFIQLQSQRRTDGP